MKEKDPLKAAEKGVPACPPKPPRAPTLGRKVERASRNHCETLGLVVGTRTKERRAEYELDTWRLFGSGLIKNETLLSNKETYVWRAESLSRPSGAIPPPRASSAGRSGSMEEWRGRFGRDRWADWLQSISFVLTLNWLSVMVKELKKNHAGYRFVSAGYRFASTGYRFGGNR